MMWLFVVCDGGGSCVVSDSEAIKQLLTGQKGRKSEMQTSKTTPRSSDRKIYNALSLMMSKCCLASPEIGQFEGDN